MKRSIELLSRETTRIDFQTASSCVYVWMIFTPTSFDISSSTFCDGQVKIFHAGSTETIFRISANCSCLDFWQIPLQIVLEALFIFNMIYVHWICFQTRGTRLVLSCSRHQSKGSYEPTHSWSWPWNDLRTFARNFSNIDFFLKIVLLKDHDLAMSEM